MKSIDTRCLRTSLNALKQDQMIEKFHRFESQQEDTEIANIYLLKGTKDKCQYCSYVHERKNEKYPEFENTCRKYEKKEPLPCSMQCQKERD